MLSTGIIVNADHEKLRVYGQPPRSSFVTTELLSVVGSQGLMLSFHDSGRGIIFL